MEHDHFISFHMFNNFGFHYNTINNRCTNGNFSFIVQ